MAAKRTTLPALPNLAEIDTAELGEAMRSLTPLQRGYVTAKVYYGLNDSEACRAAGYSEAMCSHHAHVVARNEGVQAAILETGKALLRGEGARSILVMCKIRDDGTVKPDVRLRAAEMVANRSGFAAVSISEQHVHHHTSDAEKDRRLAALCAELGLPLDQIEKALIAPADFKLDADGVYQLASEPKPLSEEPHAVAQRQTRARRRNMTPEQIEADKAQVEANRVEALRRERAAHEADRAGITIDAEFEDEPTTAEPEAW